MVELGRFPDQPLAEPSAKSVRVLTRANGADLGPATGFLVQTGDDWWLVTNWHVLSGRNADTTNILAASGATPESLRVRFHGATRLGVFTDVEIPLRDDEGAPLWVEHPTLGHHVDVAAIKLDTSAIGQEEFTTEDGGTGVRPTISWYAYDLIADSNPGRVYISVGERLSVIGFPVGEDVQGFPIWTQGFVASDPILRFRGLPCFLIDSRTRKGTSGSPVVYYSEHALTPSGTGVSRLGEAVTQRLLGVYSGRLNDESDIGRVWTPQAILNVIHGERRATSL